MKKCAVCRKQFKQWNSLTKVCGVACAIVLVDRDKKKKATARKKVDRAAKEALRPLSWHRKRMINAFNSFIRERDKDLPCISCGRHHDGVYHSGHYLTTKARPWLAVHPANAGKQCFPCNVPLSGNVLEYRPRLIEKVGLEIVEYLENSHSDYVFTIDDMEEITKHYRKELKRLLVNVE